MTQPSPPAAAPDRAEADEIMRLAYVFRGSPARDYADTERALRTAIRAVCARCAAAEAEVGRMRPVVDLAVGWVVEDKAGALLGLLDATHAYAARTPQEAADAANG